MNVKMTVSSCIWFENNCHATKGKHPIMTTFHSSAVPLNLPSSTSTSAALPWNSITDMKLFS
jgi:hypothetical protein